MRHRIAAGVLVEQDGKLLLVRHRKEGAYDFWVAPGGSAEPGEDLVQAAKREALEECGLLVEPTRLAYVEDLFTPKLRECKLWFVASLVGGKLNCGSAEAAREHIVEAAFLSPSEFEGRSCFRPCFVESTGTTGRLGFPRRATLGYGSWSSTDGPSPGA